MSHSTNKFNPAYTFDKFLVGSNNRVTYEAALAVSENLGKQHNPLFIYGGIDVGKNELLHSIGNRIHELQPDLNICYISGKEFINNLVEAIQTNQINDFRQYYRNVNVLLIDDFQFIAGTSLTANELSPILLSLRECNKQIVIFADRPPKAMSILDKRLVSLLEKGFITDIQLPDYEMRLAILGSKVKQQNIAVPFGVLEYIACKNLVNTHSLEQALEQVVEYGERNHSAITVDVATKALDEIVANNQREKVSIERVLEVVSRFFNISVEELKGRSKSQEILLARQIAVYIIREHSEKSLTAIGQALGGRTHATVKGSYDKIRGELETKAHLRQQINTIIQITYSNG